MNTKDCAAPFKAKQMAIKASDEVASSANNELVMMPRSLTAENGAKTLLMGEFYETLLIPCRSCDGDGQGHNGEHCLDCGGHGNDTVQVSVNWTTIKAIYAKAVDGLAS